MAVGEQQATLFLEQYYLWTWDLTFESSEYLKELYEVALWGYKSAFEKETWIESAIVALKCLYLKNWNKHLALKLN